MFYFTFVSGNRLKVKNQAYSDKNNVLKLFKFQGLFTLKPNSMKMKIIDLSKPIQYNPGDPSFMKVKRDPDCEA